MHDFVESGAVIISLIATGLATYTNLSIHSALSEFRNDLKEWINGSFMRSKEVKALLEGMDRRMDGLERRIELVEKS